MHRRPGRWRATRPDAFSDKEDRAGAVLRRPGRDRDRERAPVQRDQGGAGAADGDRRSPAGHQRLAWPIRTPVFDVILDSCDATVRRRSHGRVPGRRHWCTVAAPTVGSSDDEDAPRAIRAPLRTDGERPWRCGRDGPDRDASMPPKSLRRRTCSRRAPRSATFAALRADGAGKDEASGRSTSPGPTAAVHGRARSTLLKTFADQAVIAIQNVAAVQRDEGGAGTPDRDGRSAEGDQRIADRRAAGVRRDRGARGAAHRRGTMAGSSGSTANCIHVASSFGVDPEGVAAVRQRVSDRARQRVGRRARHGRCGRWSTSADVLARVRCGLCAQASADGRRRRAFAVALGVPMLRDQQVIGAITVNRAEPGLFAEKEVGSAADVRQPGGDRDRERAAVQRDPGSARAADRHGRGAAGDQRARWPTRRRSSTRSSRAASTFLGTTRSRWSSSDDGRLAGASRVRRPRGRWAHVPTRSRRIRADDWPARYRGDARTLVDDPDVRRRRATQPA